MNPRTAAWQRATDRRTAEPHAPEVDQRNIQRIHAVRTLRFRLCAEPGEVTRVRVASGSLEPLFLEAIEVRLDPVREGHAVRLQRDERAREPALGLLTRRESSVHQRAPASGWRAAASARRPKAIELAADLREPGSDDVEVAERVVTIACEKATLQKHRLLLAGGGEVGAPRWSTGAVVQQVLNGPPKCSSHPRGRRQEHHRGGA